MSFPRYAKYKDSGVEWLGEVPEHWQQVPVWLLFELGRGRVISHEEIIDNAGEYPVYSSQTENHGIMGCLNSHDFDGDYLTWTTDGANAGTVFRRSGKFNCTNVCGTLKARSSHVSLDYCWHALAISTHSFVRQDINPKLMNNVMAKIRIPIPPISEQVTIAEFLDRETAKIDELVGEQRRLMELLKEKRQAVISHAVSKGLNPHAPLKPSGIDWLGDVPAHWQIVQLKRVATIRYGIGEPPNYHEEGTPLIRATNVHAGHLLANGMVFVNPSEIPEQRIVWLTAGDIIVVRSGAYTGDSAIIPDGFGPCIAGFDMVLKCHSARPNFVQFALLSAYLKEGQIDLEKMRAAQPHLNAEELGSTVLVLPDAREQDEITDFLTSKIAEIDELTAEAQRAIDLLQERRTALISAAVTGKIDVRGLAQAEAA